MVLKVKITGIKYYKKDLEKDEIILTLNKPKTCREILNDIGIKGKLIAYFTFDGKAITLDDTINKSGTLQVIPFVSGG